MNKILLTILLLNITLFAKITNQEASLELLKSKTPIVDIRTPAEWKETGLLKGAIPIMLFNERGEYNLNIFLDQLNASVDTKKPFAIICRTGSRTVVLANFLSKKLNYDVINLKSGMMYVKYKKLPVVPYK